MSSLIIKNGTVYDPINGIDGERMDIHIKDGVIVENAGRRAKKIDCSNKIVMPGGVEIHSHIAGGKVNSGRLLRPEDHVKRVMPKTRLTRSGSGFSTPSTFMAGYLYSKMGYTTLMNPAMPPLFARHTHEELNDTPMVDKGTYTLTDGNWFVMRYLKDGDIEGCAAYISWLLKATKSLVIKLTNPGGTEAWGWGKNCKSIDDPVPYFDITPKEIIKGLVEVNEMLGLPHSVHLHANNLGRLGNYETTVDTFKIPKGIKTDKDRQILYVTHAQFHAYGGDTWKNFESKAEDVAKAVNKSDNVIIDTGNVTLDNTTTMTGDGPMEYYLQSLTHLKWINRDVELETAPGITPFVYSPKMPTATVQWAIGLELGLLIKDPWKVLLTTDHPNGGPFIRYPRIIAWLMSRQYREETLEKINKAAGKRSSISSIDREYNFNEVAIVTRAGQAKSLGFAEKKGHLGIGAHGDVAVYDIDPEKIDPSRDFKEIEKRFSATAYTIKDGKILVKDGEIVDVTSGRTYWANTQVDSKLEEEVLRDIEYNFKRYYSVNLANYPVQDKYLTRPEELKIDATKVGA
ncbi:MAG: formylmethanofuran dehydrogenase subunit A [Candidatus Hydrothermarchaeaceae archaeon]